MRQKAEERNDFHWGMLSQPCARRVLMKIMNINALSRNRQKMQWSIRVGD